MLRDVVKAFERVFMMSLQKLQHEFSSGKNIMCANE
jgi:hypothetical protein